MNHEQLKRIFEGAIMASNQPLSIARLIELFDENEQPSKETAREVLTALAQDYAEHSIELKELASGFTFQVKAEFAPWISRIWEERPGRYSRALLETLALIAYRQPITRAEIEEIRGVAVSSHIIKTLQEREWVRVVGYRDVPGKPGLYATTRQFLDHFNLKSLEELPTLAEIAQFPEGDIAGLTEQLGTQRQEVQLAMADSQQPAGEENRDKALLNNELPALQAEQGTEDTTLVTEQDTINNAEAHTAESKEPEFSLESTATKDELSLA